MGKRKSLRKGSRIAEMRPSGGGSSVDRKKRGSTSRTDTKKEVRVMESMYPLHIKRRIYQRSFERSIDEDGRE